MMNRIERLREKMVDGAYKAHRVRMSLTVLDDAEVAAAPHVIRKARALEKLLAEMPVYVQQDELIVGFRTLFDLPDYITSEEMEHRNPHIETAGRLHIFDYVYNLCQDGRGYGTANGVVPGHHNVLAKGFNGIKVDAGRKIDQLLAEGAGDESEQVQFLKAVEIVCDAVVMFAARYADEAERLAAVETDRQRKGELEAIAKVCRNVPGNVPRSFHEALQAVFFTHMVAWSEGGYLVPLGRFDQYVYPFYKADIDSGAITPDEAQELLDCLFVKFNTDQDKTHGKPSYYADTGCTMVLGGQTPAGDDATNDVTYMVLKGVETVRMADPKLRARFHTGSPDEYVRAACELIKQGMGTPSIENDETIIPALEKLGYRTEDARDYAIAGCWEIITPGRSSEKQGGAVKMPYCLEWVFNDGANFISGQKWGADTPELASLATFDDFFEAFRKQIAYYVSRMVENHNKAEWAPMPFISATLDDCIEQAKDICDGGARYNDIGFQLTGIANMADALLVIKRLVYEDKKLTLQEMRDILISNYEGREDLRQRILTKFAKFGNDDDEVDLLAGEIGRCFAGEVSRHRTRLGGHFRPRISTGGDHAFTKAFGASPDGRKAGERFAVSASPAPGRDLKGPTAVIKSVAKLDLETSNGGANLDMMFHPAALAGNEGTEKLMALVRTFVQLGGMQLQVNVVSNETLTEARKHPEDYRHLVVRVYGFTTYFTQLLPELQDHLITRSEYEYSA